MTEPVVYMIAGPNGAGKTTLAYKAMPQRFRVHEFVNADEIARGLSPFNVDGQAMAAGRLMIDRINHLIAAKTSFTFETTGASRMFSTQLKRAKAAGYHIGLFYVWLPNAQAAKDRVKLRVSQGGHNIPEDTIERRHTRSIRNLVNLYLPLADKADIYHGGLAQDEQRIIAQKLGKSLVVIQPEIWHNITTLAEGAADANDD